MATVSDTFNRANTSQGTLGSTDTGNLAWQGATYWSILDNAANDTQTRDVAWCIIPNSDAEVGIETGVDATLGNGVGVAFWVKDASNYWLAYVYGERYVHHVDNVCVSGCKSCTSATDCGTNQVIYTSGQTSNYVGSVGCSCADNSHGECSCSANGVASRAGGNVTETATVCDGANCRRESGTDADTCDVNYSYNSPNYNALNYNSPTYNALNYNTVNYNAPTYAYNKAVYAYNAPGNKVNGYNFGGNAKFSYVPGTSFLDRPSTKNTTPGNVSGGGNLAGGGNLKSPGNLAGGGNLASPGTKKTTYNCIAGGYVVGGCSSGPCVGVGPSTFTCGNKTCDDAYYSCSYCGTTGSTYSITCTCTASGGNAKTCVPTTCTDPNCIDPCASTTPVDVYYYRYYLKVDRVASGTATNHYTSTALYDNTGSSQTWGSIKVVTTGGSYTAYVYTDSAWTTEAANSGSQASGQTDYLSSVGHGMGVAPLGDQNPAETNQIDYWYTTYTPLAGDSVGIIVG